MIQTPTLLTLPEPYCAITEAATGAYVPETHAATPDEAMYGPRLEVRQVPGPQGVMALTRRNNLLFAAGQGTFWVFDVSQPLEPRVIGHLDGIHEARQMALAGNVACITARARGLYLVDISDPTQPQLLLRYDTIELATGVDTAGTLVFVGLRTNGVETIDISDPRHPKTLSIVKTDEAQSQVYDHGKLYVGDWGSGRLTVLDVTNPCAPRKLASLPLYGYGDGVAMRGNLVAASTGHHRKVGPEENRLNQGHAVSFVDVANPSQPQLLSVFPFPPFYASGDDFWTVRLAGKYAACVDTINGLFLVDITDPKAPKGAGWAHLPLAKRRNMMLPDVAATVGVGDGVIYVGGKQTGLFVVPRPDLVPDVEDHGEAPAIPKMPAPAIPEGFERYDAGGQVRGVSLMGDIAWVACSHAGLHALRLSRNGFTPVAKHAMRCSYDVKYVDGLLYSAEGEDGLAIYRPGEDGSLEELGRALLPDEDLVQMVWKPAGRPFCAISNRGGNILFLDVSNPAQIVAKFRHGQRGIVYGDMMANELFAGRYMLFNWHNGGMAWYDVGGSEPTLGNFIFKSINFHDNGCCAFRGKGLYVRNGKINILEPNQGEPIEQWVEWQPDYPASGIPTVDDEQHVLAVSNRLFETLDCFDITDCQHPTRLPNRSWQFHNNLGTVVFWNHQLLIPLGHAGLLLETRR
ncbi:MAG: hypothetical protein IJJ26_05595 [Victivallales bacterium]|nr:hypothetical protein [Victivallales bacterium]